MSSIDIDGPQALTSPGRDTDAVTIGAELSRLFDAIVGLQAKNILSNDSAWHLYRQSTCNPTRLGSEKSRTWLSFRRHLSQQDAGNIRSRPVVPVSPPLSENRHQQDQTLLNTSPESRVTAVFAWRNLISMTQLGHLRSSRSLSRNGRNGARDLHR